MYPDTETVPEQSANPHCTVHAAPGAGKHARQPHAPGRATAAAGPSHRAECDIHAALSTLLQGRQARPTPALTLPTRRTSRSGGSGPDGPCSTPPMYLVLGTIGRGGSIAQSAVNRCSASRWMTSGRVVSTPSSRLARRAAPPQHRAVSGECWLSKALSQQRAVSAKCCLSRVLAQQRAGSAKRCLSSFEVRRTAVRYQPDRNLQRAGRRAVA